MRRSVTIASMAMLGLLGCNPVAEQQPPAPAPSESVEPGPPAASDSPNERTITGTLDGDAQLEGGCVWIDTPEGAIEPLLPEGYTTTADPVAVLGPDGEVIAEGGDQVTITGSPATDVSTICQVGEVWRVSAIEAGEG